MDDFYDTPPASPTFLSQQMVPMLKRTASDMFISVNKNEKAKATLAAAVTNKKPRTKTEGQRRGRPKKPDPVTSMTPAEFINAQKHLKISIAESNSDPATEGTVYDEIATVCTSKARENKTGKVGWTFSHKATVKINGSPIHVQMSGTIYALRSERWKRDAPEVTTSDNTSDSNENE